MRVTDIVKDGRKYRIFLDGEEEFWLYLSEVRALQMQENMEMTQEQYQHIMYEYIAKRAKKRALHLLEKKDRTKKQLITKLNENGYPVQVIEIAVAYVESYHYLDDRRYVENYVELHKERDSRQKMKMDLMHKGVEKETIDTLLESMYREEDDRETDQIGYWLEKKHYPMQPGDEKEKRRVYQFLMRKGYRSGEVLAEMERAEKSYK